MTDVSLSRLTIKAIAKSEYIMQGFDEFWDGYGDEWWNKTLPELHKLIRRLTGYEVKLHIAIDGIEDTLRDDMYYNMNDITTWDWELTECQIDKLNEIIIIRKDIEEYIERHYHFDHTPSEFKEPELQEV